jgi:hypothetical protein
VSSALEGARPGSTGTRGLVLVVGGWVTVMLALAALIAALGGSTLSTPSSSTASVAAPGVSAFAERDIPPLYLRLYRQAAQHYGIDWAILAGIGKVECDHGRAPAPTCTQEGAVNSAGAGGPMQFIASTWATYGVDAEGDGPPDRWNPADAIYAAARFLRASGAPRDYRQAIFAYDHAQSYVDEVESWAARYSADGVGSAIAPVAPEGGAEAPEGIAGADLALEGESSTAVHFIPGEQAQLAPGDGHLALVPAGVPAPVQAMVVAGNELQDLPYGPGGHPDPLGAYEEDCSSTVNYVLYRAGVRPLAEIVRDNPLAQSYVYWGAPGPGRWVTVYATDAPQAHVFMTIAGLRLDTSHDGTDVGPNRYENGPRWRILDHIPTWAHWSVRHPPGL